MIKTCFLTTSYPSNRDDSRGIFLYKLVEHLRKNGVQVNVLSPRSEKFKVITGGGGILPNLRKNPLLSLLIFGFYTLNFLFLIIKNAKKSDVIHANWSYTAFLALLTKFYHKKKIILTERAPYLVSTKNSFLKLFLKLTYNHVDVLAAISEYSRNKLASNHGIKRKILVIQNGVDIPKKNSRNILLKKLGLPKDKFIVTDVGRIEKIKGMESLIYSSLKVKDKCRNILYLIIGDGTQLDYYKKLANRLGVSNYFKFVGRVNHQLVIDYLQASNAFVFPTLDETGGNALIEAMACGLPVITTEVGWGYDLVEDGKNGIIIRKNNADDITKNILMLIRNKKLANKIGRNAKKTVMAMTWDKSAKNYAGLYYHVIKS